MGRLTIVPVKFGKQSGVVFHVCDHVHKSMVFRRRADHRRAADVDVFDAGVEIRTLGNGFLKRVKVHNQQVDWANVVLFHRLDMRGKIATGQKATMHNGVQRLDPTIHHLRKARHIGHIFHIKASIAQRLGRAAS